jgi:hypothetical protein
LAAVAAAFLQMVFPIQMVPTVDRVAEVEISMDQVPTELLAKAIEVEIKLATFPAAVVVAAAAAPVVLVLMQYCHREDGATVAMAEMV